MKVIIRVSAESDLDNIFSWIAKDNPRAATEIVRRIKGRINRLALNALSEMGRPGFIEGTRELVEYPYVIVYKIFEDRREIAVLSILHGARDPEGRGD